MAFISAGQLARSLEKLQPFHAFYGVTFLSMKKAGVGVGTGTVWGGPQEEALLRQHDIRRRGYLPRAGMADGRVDFRE